MTRGLDARVAAIKADYEWCFGCGLRNPMGLRIGEFDDDGELITARYRPRHDHRGFEGVLHGGILATALDEVLAWTAILRESVMVVTGTLNLRYRKPAPAEGEYRLEGRLLERRGRRLKLAGRALHEETVVAEAEGLFLVAHEVEVT